ncbi:hypothetical protein D3C81_1005370 [compost metagenome]
MHRNVRAGGGVRCRRQVVGVGFARHLEHGDGQALRHFRLAGEPFGIGPALQHALGIGVAGLGLFLHVMECIKHQQRVLEAIGGDRAHIGVVQQLDQRRDVVTAKHGAQQFGGALAADQRVLLAAQCDRGQVRGLDLGSVIDAGRHAVGDQVEQELGLACGRVLQQLDDVGRLLCGQRQRRDAKRGALGYVVAVGFQHDNSRVLRFENGWAQACGTISFRPLK